MEFLITKNDEGGRVRADRAFRTSDTGRAGCDLEIPLCHQKLRLVCRAPEADISMHVDRDSGLILIGTQRANSDSLRRELATYRTPKDAFSIFRRVPGSYFTMLAWGEQLFVFGTLSNNRRVMLQAEHSLIASDGDVLRRACGAELNDDHLALTLMMLQPPSLVNERTPWTDIVGVPSTEAAVVTTGGVNIVTRWTPQQASTRLAEGAEAIQDAIRAAVDARHGSGRVSTDLSGGMDSTTVAFFAHQRSSNLVTIFRPGTDLSNDDQAWTQRAMRSLPGAEHVEISAEANAPWYSEWLTPGERSLESPLPSSRTSGYLRTVASIVSSAGSSRHLTGIGGDELFHPGFSLIREQSLTHPFWAWRGARAAQAMGRWRTTATLRALYSRESYSHWRQRVAGTLTAPPEVQGVPPTDWEPRPLLPPWASAESVERVRRIVLEDAADDTPAWGVSEHESLSLITLSGSLIRRFSSIFEAQGVTYEAPLLDDHLIELALAIHPVDRIQGASYKPVLAAAGGGVVPPDLLGRQTKGDYSREAYTGMKYSRPSILREFENSELARRGLIDVNRFKSAITGVHPDTRVFQFLDPTLTAEAWLRQVDRPLQTTGLR